MKAAVVRRYGGPEVVDVVEVPRPQARRGEVLVRVHAAAVTSGDARIRAARFPGGFAVPSRLLLGLRGPRQAVLGTALSGVVEAVGDAVTSFAVGDAVCAMNAPQMGGHAEYVAVDARRLVNVPPGVSHDDAAGVLFGGATAMHFLLTKGHLGAGMTVLVNGASGAVGTSAVQLARQHGAVVTGVCSAANRSLVADLGASEVIDYRVTPLTELTGRYDLVLDTVGNLDLRSGRRLLTDRGILLLASASLGQVLRARGNVVAGLAAARRKDLALLLQQVAEGSLRVIHDQTFSLADIRAAHSRVDSGRKVGNVVVRP
ncbi:MAG: NAD(P)-dependent alcohol dehydrogenase [Alphaproteobacteria bacterium]|nr:NAD(P)-dependent alcohol dehydrogenase [Alphaproteobacteria bacterium]